MNDAACARSTVSSGQYSLATQPLEMPRRLASLIHAESGWLGHGASPKSHWHAGGVYAPPFLARRTNTVMSPRVSGASGEKVAPVAIPSALSCAIHAPSLREQEASGKGSEMHGGGA